MLKRKMIVIAAVLIVGTSMPVSAAEDEGITVREHDRENLGGLTMDTEGRNILRCFRRLKHAASEKNFS